MTRPDFHARRAWFDDPAPEGPDDVRDKLLGIFGATCPCCGYPLFGERGAFEICPLCRWEDDGLDDAAARPGELDRVSGPNHTTLRRAREHFEKHCVEDTSRGRIVPGMNDPAAVENNRRAVEALDALMTAADVEEVTRLVRMANEAMGANHRTLLDGGYGENWAGEPDEARYSPDGYLLTEEDDWPDDLTGVQLRILSKCPDHLRILKEDEFGLVAKYWETTLDNWEHDMNAAIRLEKLFRDGGLSPEQETEYRGIKASLGDAVPLIEELGLSRPPIPLD